MAVYSGVKCISCGKTLREDDDIVVCPICGTPYHRACYAEEGTCVNTELHESGRSFSESTAGQAPREDIRCPRCAAVNEPLSLFCKNCGMPLNGNVNPRDIPRTDTPPQNESLFGDPLNVHPFNVNFSDPLCGLNPEETYDDVALTDLADFVGNNTFFYLPMFKRMKDTGHKLTWNFSAMLFPEFFLAYRKMYLATIVIVLLEIIMSIPSIAVTFSGDLWGDSFLSYFASLFDTKSASFQFAANLAYFGSYVFRFACGAFVNWFYYRHSIHKIKKIRASSPPNPSEKIRARGGVSTLAAILVPAALLFILAVASSAHMMLRIMANLNAI